jgi:hypothetical protein
VRPVPVEVGDVLPEHTDEPPLTEDEQLIEAFTTHAPEEALAQGIRPWRTPLAAATCANTAPYLRSLSRMR